MYDDILIPTDGSEMVTETLEHAIPLARQHEATIHALYVVDRRITTAADSDSQTDLARTLERDGEAAVMAVREHIETADADLEVVETVEYGTPSKAILEYADREAIDLIAIGTRGKTPREKVTSLGSVSERVVDNATVPVFVVRSPAA